MSDVSADEKSLLKKIQNNGTTAHSPTSDTDTTKTDNVVPKFSSGTLSHKSADGNDLTVAEDKMKSSFSFLQKIGFGLGHVYNDLCAGVWFSYTLLFMQGSLQMSGAEAGALVMLGQVGDALFTPIVGILTDKYGTKRRWHISGMSCH